VHEDVAGAHFGTLHAIKASRISASFNSRSIKYGRASCLRYPSSSVLNLLMVSIPSTSASRTFNL
jgi:hypothetical protein